MRVEFLGMTISNFMCFEHVEFEFRDGGFYLVVGEVEGQHRDSNGAGKSALFEALTWVLFGKTIRDVTVTKVVRVGADVADVHLTFRKGVRLYSLERRRTTEGVGTYVKFQGRDSESANFHDLTTAAMVETDRRIVEVLGFSFEIWKNSIFYGQGLPYRFIQVTDSQKKVVMDEILALSWLQDAQEKTSEVVQVYNAVQEAVSAKIASLKVHEQVYQQERDGYRMRRHELLENQQSQDIATDKRLLDVAALLILKKAELGTAERERSSFSSACTHPSEEEVRELEFLRKREAELRVQRAESFRSLEEKMKQRDELLEEKVCPLCKSSLTSDHQTDLAEVLRIEISGFQASADEVSKSLDTTAVNLGVAERAYEAHRVQAEKEMREMEERREKVMSLGMQIATLQNEQLELQEVAKENYAANSMIAELDQSIEQVEDRIGAVWLEMQKEEGVVASSDEVLKALSYWKEGFSNRGAKAFILETIFPYLNGRARHYSDLLTNGEFQVTFRVSGEPYERFTVEVSSEDSEVDYSQFSGGEKRRADVVVLLALHDLIRHRNQIDTNIQVFDEVCENLDAVGIEKLMAILRTRGADRNVFVISHNMDFASNFEDFIAVSKDAAGVSSVAYQRGRLGGVE